MTTYEAKKNLIETCERNVSKVPEFYEKAHDQLQEELMNMTLEEAGEQI